MSTTEPNQPPAPAPVSKGVPEFTIDPVFLADYANRIAAEYVRLYAEDSSLKELTHARIFNLVQQHKPHAAQLIPVKHAPSAEAAQRVASGETPTPRTDAEEFWPSHRHHAGPVCDPAFARGLERELAEAKAEVKFAANMNQQAHRAFSEANARTTELERELTAANERVAELGAGIDKLANRAGFPKSNDFAQMLVTVGNKVERLERELTTAQDSLHEKEVHCGQLLCQLTTAQSAAAAAERKLALEIRCRERMETRHGEVLAELVQLRAQLRPPAVAQQQTDSGNDMTARESMAADNPFLAQIIELKKEIEGLDNEASELINERDEAEEAADQMASHILKEPIDWSDHQGKWKEAIEESAEPVTPASSSVAVEHGRLVEALSEEAAGILSGRPKVSHDSIREVVAGVIRTALTSTATPHATASEDAKANDLAIERGENEKYRARLAWLGNPQNSFSYSITPDGQVKVGTRFSYRLYKTMEAAIDAAMMPAASPRGQDGGLG